MGKSQVHPPSTFSDNSGLAISSWEWFEWRFSLLGEREVHPVLAFVKLQIDKLSPARDLLNTEA